MAMNSDNIAVVRPKVDGAVYVATKGTAVPNSAVATATSFNSLGWISEDGISCTVARETVDLKGMGGATALTIQSSYDVTFKFKPMELNEHTAKMAFGAGNVTVSSGAVSAIKMNADELDEFAVMFDLHGRDNELIRVCIPNGKVVETGDISFKHNESSIIPELTVKAYPDASGVNAYLYKAKQTTQG